MDATPTISSEETIDAAWRVCKTKHRFTTKRANDLVSKLADMLRRSNRAVEDASN